MILFTVRGYVTGSTDTSLWTVYQKGVRNYCGNAIPDGGLCNCEWSPFFYYKYVLLKALHLFVTGMVKNQMLPENIITPTTKAADHDVPITPEEVCFFLYLVGRLNYTLLLILGSLLS